MTGKTSGKAAKTTKVAKSKAARKVSPAKARKTVKAAKKTSGAKKATKTAAPRKAVKKTATKTAGSVRTSTGAGPRKATKATARKSSANRAASKAASKKGAAKGGEPKLLSGGNPQIPKGYGDAPVQAYIAAMPGWKRDLGRRLDALIERAVPGVNKAVKWNSPLYGMEGQGWFLGVHCFTRYVKLTFFRGAALRPMPPGESKMAHTRHLDIHEDEALDETQLADWLKQASRLPGERM